MKADLRFPYGYRRGLTVALPPHSIGQARSQPRTRGRGDGGHLSEGGGEEVGRPRRSQQWSVLSVQLLLPLPITCTE